MRRAAVALLGLALAACSAHSSSPAKSSSAPGAVRFWSNAAATAGSTIEGTVKLKPSRGDYCAMLGNLLEKGGSVLSAPAADPTAHATRTEFVAEITQVAPAQVADAWKLLAPALDSLAAGKAPAGSTALQAAASTVAADAKSTCHLSLTS